MDLRVGLIGYSCDTGLGTINRAFFEKLPFRSWLVVDHPSLGHSALPNGGRCVVLGGPSDRSYLPAPQDGSQRKQLDQWLKEVDVVFAVERPYVQGLWSLARRYGVKTVLMPMSEWFRPNDPETAYVDIFLAPTRACADQLAGAGLGSRTCYIPLPVDTDRFSFRRRTRARLFVHYRGWGGYAERKGTDIVIEAARRLPDVPFLIRYQRPINTALPLPMNVHVLDAVSTPEQLYSVGDIAVQPSRWEGVGLQILEAMSCGLPTLVPDAAPMNEYPADRSLCIGARKVPVLIDGHPWIAAEIVVDSLVEAIRTLHKTDIGPMSDAARAKMIERSWTRLRSDYMHVFGM